ncbi:FAD-dependent oxidoreductase [Oricola cellulosilytica]|uniref:FAD-dependent oxidoreductase n=1 Tax=Oricola cellulosilytica TaxID=1429082 RepID=A0A4R0PAL5_9HYPH|nr:FAD-dependent oxidoreductase [Oricola cellulosilytica]TCD13335.1 FAD-dependent oxidoreductase [Oricola cellulosilytica]
MRVTVIGAGVAGLACATVLAERGAEVEVIERSPDLLADACSRHAGGMLAPWCELESAEEPVARLGAEAIDWWEARVREVWRQGSLVLAPPRDRAELDRFARRTERFARVGGEEIAELEPDLAERFCAGLLFAEEAHLCPRCALKSLAQRLREMGVAFRHGVDGREAGAGASTDLVIDCRGFAARDSLPELRGVKGEMLLVRTRDVALNRPVRLLHPRIPLYIVPRGAEDGLYMVGATMIESAERDRITARSMVELLNAAYALHPAFAEAEIVDIGADVRPAFPDNMPRLCWRNGRLYVNGLYRHGFLLAPALARMAADAALGKEALYAH